MQFLRLPPQTEWFREFFNKNSWRPRCTVKWRSMLESLQRLSTARGLGLASLKWPLKIHIYLLMYVFSFPGSIITLLSCCLTCIQREKLDTHFLLSRSSPKDFCSMALVSAIFHAPVSSPPFPWSPVTHPTSWNRVSLPRPCDSCSYGDRQQKRPNHSTAWDGLNMIPPFPKIRERKAHLLVFICKECTWKPHRNNFYHLFFNV